MTKRALWFAAALAVLTLLLAPIATEASATAPAAAAPKTTITWLKVDAEEKAEAWKAVTAKWCEANGIHLVIRTVPWNDAETKMLTAAVSANPPDIATSGNWIEYGRKGIVYDLTSFPDFEEATRDLVQQGIPRFRGAAYSLPTADGTFMVMYYRKDILKSLGYTQFPDTWAEFNSCVEKMQAKGMKGVTVQWGNMGWMSFAPFLWQAGGDFYSKDGAVATLDTPEALTAMKQYGDLWLKYGVDKGGWPEMEKGLTSGKIPIGISGLWVAGYLDQGFPEMKGKWSIAMMPAGPSGRRTTFLGGEQIAMFKKTKNPEAAWKLIKYLMSPEAQVAYYKAMLKDSLLLPSNLKAWEEIELPDPSLKDALYRQLKDSRGPDVTVLSFRAAQRYIDEAIQKIIVNGADPVETLASLTATMNRKIKEMR
ncbi:MAG: extracellular solute-binding protein [Clostridia bacterium]|nr:extracellular solute-binding protein [Clostridia bacterium]